MDGIVLCGFQLGGGRWTMLGFDFEVDGCVYSGALVEKSRVGPGLRVKA